MRVRKLEIPMNWHGFVPHLLRMHRVRRVAEIGVWEGELSQIMMQQCPEIEHLYLVDPWAVCYGRLETGRWVVHGPGYTDDEMEAAAQMTHSRMQPFGHRVTILRQSSVEGAKAIPEESLDAVLIDALHYAGQVTEDIRAWLPKLRAGGLMIGDDLGPGFPGVELGVRSVFAEDYKVWGMAERSTWWAQKESACLQNV